MEAGSHYAELYGLIEIVCPVSGFAFVEELCLGQAQVCRAWTFCNTELFLLFIVHNLASPFMLLILF